MANIPHENRKALADMNWEDRLKKARARREAVLRARSANAGTGQDQTGPTTAGGAPTADSKTAETNLTFTDRLERARAQREEVLRARNRTGAAEDQAPTEAPRPVAVEPQEEPQDWPDVAPAAAVMPSPGKSGVARRRIGFAVVAFCIGIVAGVGLMNYDGPLPGNDAAAPEQPMAEAPAPAVVAEPGQTAQAQAPAPAEPAAEGPTAIADLDTELVPPVPAVLQTALARIAVSIGTTPEAASLAAPAVDRFPRVSVIVPPPPREGEPLGTENPPALLEDPGTLGPLSFDAGETALAGSRPVARSGAFDSALNSDIRLPTARPVPRAADPAPETDRLSAASPDRPSFLSTLVQVSAPPEPAGGLSFALATVDDPVTAVIPAALSTIPAGLSRDIGATGAPAVTDHVTYPDIPGADFVILHIFAADSVGDDVVAELQDTVDGLRLPVVAVNRVDYRISENQVRYYDDRSAEAADIVARTIGARARDFTASGVNPEPGTIEIYIGTGIEITPQVSTVATRTDPETELQDSELEDMRSRVISRLRDAMDR
ncbi:hypothetical protein HKCCE3408_14485 [Rhodobacterales bacterium HKCCE3408]|nr:hypothetical protein [Rhodobacterales bacterium HKCCE3408]